MPVPVNNLVRRAFQGANADTCATMMCCRMFEVCYRCLPTHRLERWRREAPQERREAPQKGNDDRHG
jgi:hypothetical protein